MHPTIKFYLGTSKGSLAGISRDIIIQMVIIVELLVVVPKNLYYNHPTDSTLSKSMTVVAGNGRLRNVRENPTQETRLNRSRSHHHEGSESDTSISPVNEFSNAPTYRIPIKPSRDIFRPDSSTESNNDNSPLRDRRSNTPHHISNEKRQRSSRGSQSMDIQSNNR